MELEVLIVWNVVYIADRHRHIKKSIALTELLVHAPTFFVTLLLRFAYVLVPTSESDPREETCARQ